MLGPVLRPVLLWHRRPPAGRAQFEQLVQQTRLSSAEAGSLSRQSNRPAGGVGQRCCGCTEAPVIRLPSTRLHDDMHPSLTMRS